MEVLLILLLLITTYFIFQSVKLHREASNLRYITIEYVSLICLLMDSHKISEEAFKKEIWRSFVIDSNTLSVKEFTRKWDALFQAFNVPSHKDKYGITSKGLSRVASLLASNLNITINEANNMIKQYPSTLTLEQLEKLGEASDNGGHE